MNIGADYSGNDLLVIDGLNYRINDVHILKDIGFKAGRREFIGLIGPNGAGKTTLLKCINRINKADGRIEIGGIDFNLMNSREIAGKVAMLHQNTAISFPFTALDIVLTARYHKTGRLKAESREDYKTARSCMEFTDTLKYETRQINTLSGGERQRVLFAKVLAQETELMLLDEPSSSLDIAHEVQIFKYSAQLCSEGKTVIAAVHDLKTAVHFCTRLILMKDGRIISDGTPETVITRENLSRAFDVNALVYRNRISGFIDFYIPGQTDKLKNVKIHVIGGGGSASGVIRQLFEGGYDITAGVFSHGDSDLGCADIYGVRTVACQPFSEIDEAAMKENIELIRAADMTILCNMPFGQQNMRNLEAASNAAKLVIIEDENPQNRDFTGGEAMLAYNGLKKRAIVIEEAKLHEVLP